ncbi:MAG: sulfatase [bacterium]|nr:sulfatase [bacterium]
MDALIGGPAPVAPRPAVLGRLAGLAALSLAVLFAGCAPSEHRGTEGRSFVLVSVDTLNRSALEAFERGAGERPALDRFAGESVRLLDAHSTASWTLPAHASLLTGLYPDRHGTTDPRHRLAAGVPTLAAALSGAGYETVGWTEGGYLSERFGLGAGFELYEKNERASRGVFGKAIDFLRRRPARSRPFFLFLHTFQVHDYYKARPRVVERLPADAELGNVGRFQDCLQGRSACEPADWRTMRDLYRIEVDLLDAAFGQLLAALAESGHEDRTFVILISDHGEGLDPERGRTHHAGRLHEDQIRIPALIRGPGVEARDLRMPVSLVDLMPTILDLAGVASPAELDGVSLAPALEGGDSPGPRPLFALEHAFWWPDGQRKKSHSPRHRAISIAVIENGLWYVGGPRGDQVYDVRSDPRQSRNLAAESERLRALRRLARQRRLLKVEPSIRSQDRETESELRSLGYL